MLKKVLRQIRKAKQFLIKLFFKKHKLVEVQEEILEKLENEGIYISNVSLLKNLNISLDWMKYSNEIKEYLDNKEKTGEHELNLKGSYAVGMRNIPNYILEKIYDFALNENLVKIIENYFQLPLSFKGVDIRKDINDKQKIETRLWHLDSEDAKIIKILFYLDNVDKYSGPFQFIKKNVVNKKTYINKKTDFGRVEDEVMNSVCKINDINKFTGTMQEFAIVDTANIYHKGAVPIKSRYTIFFCYNSRYPLTPEYCLNFQRIDKSIFNKKYYDMIAN